MEVSLAQRPAPHYQAETVISTAISTVAVAPATQLMKTTETDNAQRQTQVDKSQLLSVDLPDQPSPTLEQTLKPYGVIMLPYREEDTVTARKF